MDHSNLSSIMIVSSGLVNDARIQALFCSGEGEAGTTQVNDLHQRMSELFITGAIGLLDLGNIHWRWNSSQVSCSWLGHSATLPRAIA